MESGLVRKLIPEQGNILRLVWVLETECPECGDLVENRFFYRPSQVDLITMQECPCDECIERLDQAEAKIHPRRNTKGHERKKMRKEMRSIRRLRQ